MTPQLEPVPRTKDQGHSLLGHPATQWVALAAMVIVAEIVFLSGQTNASIALDVVAVIVFFRLRKLRENTT